MTPKCDVCIHHQAVEHRDTHHFCVGTGRDDPKLSPKEYRKMHECPDFKRKEHSRELEMLKAAAALIDSYHFTTVDKLLTFLEYKCRFGMFEYVKANRIIFEKIIAKRRKSWTE